MKNALRRKVAVFLVGALCLSCPFTVWAEPAQETAGMTETVESREDQETSAGPTAFTESELEKAGEPEITEATEMSAELETEKTGEPETTEELETSAEPDTEKVEEPEKTGESESIEESELEGLWVLPGDREAQEEILPLYGTPSFCTAEEWEVLRLTNKERMKNGLQPLSTYPALQSGCDIRANEIAVQFSHTRPNGQICVTALDEAGAVYNCAGENIASGHTSPAMVVDAWMNSEGHRANILDGDYTHMGSGHMRESTGWGRQHWVQLFTGVCIPSKISVQNTSGLVEIEPGTSIDSLGLTLEVTCSHGTSYLPLMDEMCSGYRVDGEGKPQTVQVSYRGRSTSFQVGTPFSVRYQTHVQSKGWQEYKANGAMSGTSGEAKRLEGIRIKLAGQDVSGNVEYRTHVQTYGWEDGWKRNGELSGTTGESKRLEAIQIRLTGEMAEKYDIYYRVHAQTYGWLGWAKNGASAGTEGYAKRLEAIEIRLQEKGSKAPGSTSGAYRKSQIQYETHVQTYGWQGKMWDGEISGTTGEAKRLEGIQIQLTNQEYTGNVEYRTHVQTYGWEQKWTGGGGISGTTGEAKRLEAIQIRLTGEMAKKYDVYYQVHAQTYGWLGWAKNGASAGTAGYAKRLEGIRICLVPKGSAAPGSTANCYISRNGN